MTKVSVVIPFFQRKEGILRAAVESALNQKTSATVQIIVVDDESPISAGSELRDLCLSHPDAIVIVEQKNAGAGAARNAGLDHVSQDTDFVAFLDSDDIWTDSHIERAVRALNYGYDFYFSDFYQVGQTITAFNRAARIRVKDHPQIDPAEPIHEYGGDMVDQILTGNILGTPTIVYNFKKFPAFRFPVDFRHAGEDYIFWICLTSNTKKIVFSSEPECRCGPGVNIFSDSGWGTDKYLTVLHDLIKYKKYLLDSMQLTDSQKTSLAIALRDYRVSYVMGLLHNLLHNWRVAPGILWKQILLDPQTFFTLPLISGKVIYQRLRRSA